MLSPGFGTLSGGREGAGGVRAAIRARMGCCQPPGIEGPPVDATGRAWRADGRRHQVDDAGEAAGRVLGVLLVLARRAPTLALGVLEVVVGILLQAPAAQGVIVGGVGLVEPLLLLHLGGWRRVAGCGRDSSRTTQLERIHASSLRRRGSVLRLPTRLRTGVVRCARGMDRAACETVGGA